VVRAGEISKGEEPAEVLVVDERPGGSGVAMAAKMGRKVRVEETKIGFVRGVESELHCDG